MQLEECKAAGGESELDPLCLDETSVPACCGYRGIAAPCCPGEEGALQWHWEGNWDLLGRELGFTGKGFRALEDLGDEVEPWKGRLQPGFLLCPSWSMGCSGLCRAGFAPGMGSMHLRGLNPSVGVYTSPGGGGGGLKHLRAGWGLTRRRGPAGPCVWGGDISHYVTSRFAAPQDGDQPGKSCQPPPRLCRPPRPGCAPDSPPPPPRSPGQAAGRQGLNLRLPHPHPTPARPPSALPPPRNFLKHPPKKVGK